MARIAGVDLPREKRIEVSLQYIYGIGKTSAQLILERANVSPVTRTKDLTDDEVRRIRETIEQNVKVEGDLRRAGSPSAMQAKAVAQPSLNARRMSS